MRSRRMFSCVDSHTEGMPTRVVTGGIGVLEGDTMLDRMHQVVAERDDLRSLLMCEPRGHAAMSGAILQPPTRPDADWGVVFIEVSGCLPMCGHGSMGVATVLVETGMVDVVEPVTEVRLDTPAGLVVASVTVDAGRATSVQIRNVASYSVANDVVITVPGVGDLTIDLAYGGNFYALIPAAALGIPLTRAAHDDLIATGLRIIDAVNHQVPLVHPEVTSIAGCRHVIVTEEQGVDIDGEPVDGRSATVILPGWIDRSPCGTGTSARMAQRHSRGALAIGQPYVHASLLGSRFIGELVETTTVGDRPAVVPTVRGRAWITGLAQYLLDPTDPFPQGFRMKDDP